MFYRFRQNNSGGRFVRDNNLNTVVIIEADSNEKMMEVADNIGIYFGGVAAGLDCECCGDRWDYPTESEEMPQIHKFDFFMDGGVVVHFKDGSVKHISEPQKENEPYNDWFIKGPLHRERGPAVEKDSSSSSSSSSSSEFGSEVIAGMIDQLREVQK
jgi:hypothetical protein